MVRLHQLPRMLEPPSPKTGRCVVEAHRPPTQPMIPARIQSRARSASDPTGPQ